MPSSECLDEYKIMPSNECLVLLARVNVSYCWHDLSPRSGGGPPLVCVKNKMSLPIVGARISLISKSDIRYVGILHSINHEESSVSLEQGKLKCTLKEGSKAWTINIINAISTINVINAISTFLINSGL